MAILPLDLQAPLPDGWIPVDVVSVVKCLDEEGEVQVCVRQSGGLSMFEAIGMLTAANDLTRASLTASFEEGD